MYHVTVLASPAPVIWEPPKQIFFFASDVNECTEGTDNCNINALCTNTVGSFTCACNEGFSGDGVDCEGEPDVGCTFYSHLSIRCTPTSVLVSGFSEAKPI